jgi:hypothetical protein
MCLQFDNVCTFTSRVSLNQTPPIHKQETMTRDRQLHALRYIHQTSYDFCRRLYVRVTNSLISLSKGEPGPRGPPGPQGRSGPPVSISQLSLIAFLTATLTSFSCQYRDRQAKMVHKVPQATEAVQVQLVHRVLLGQEDVMETL